MNASPRSPWAIARTVIAASGLGFVATALGGACLDYAGETFGACPTSTPVLTSTGAGSGSGNGQGSAPVGATSDCGAPGVTVPEAGGSGSAAP